MAKELPYFKFEPAAWDTGKIQMCSFEVQGIFIGLCSMYWQRLGNLPYKLALQKVCGGNATALRSLCDEGAIKIIDEMICIDFLNEQLDEFGELSKTNSENARLGWEKRRNNATAMPPQSDRNAIREEERREEKNREEEKKPLRAAEKKIIVENLFPVGTPEFFAWEEWLQYRREIKKKLPPSTVKKQMKFLGGRAGPEIVSIINQSIVNGWTGLFELKNNGNKDYRTTTKGTIRRADATVEAPRDFGNF